MEIQRINIINPTKGATERIGCSLRFITIKIKIKDYEQNDEMVLGSGGDGGDVRMHED